MEKSDLEKRLEELEQRLFEKNKHIKLKLYKDYYIGGKTGDKFIFPDDATANDTINIYYKAIPARINDIADDITDMPDILWASLIEVAVMHAKLKDENLASEQAVLIQAALRSARGQIARQQGMIRNLTTY